MIIEKIQIIASRKNIKILKLILYQDKKIYILIQYLNSM